MSVTLSDDPISRVMRAMMQTLMLHEDLRTLVRPGNRLDYAGGIDSSPVKENPITNDLPELSIYPNGGIVNPPQGGGVSSSSMSIVQRFIVGIATEEQRASMDQRGVNECKWRLIQACQRIQHDSQADMVMGLPEVRIFRIGEFFDEMNRDVIPAPTPRLITGWVFGLSVEVLMVFDRVEMMA